AIWFTVPMNSRQRKGTSHERRSRQCEAAANVDVSKVTSDLADNRESKEGLRLYLDLVARAPIGLMVLRLENMEDVGSFRILAANSAVIPVSGMPDLAVDSLIGRSFAEVSPAISATELPELFAAVIRSGSPRHLGEIRYGDERLP